MKHCRYIEGEASAECPYIDIDLIDCDNCGHSKELCQLCGDGGRTGMMFIGESWAKCPNCDEDGVVARHENLCDECSKPTAGAHDD